MASFHAIANKVRPNKDFKWYHPTKFSQSWRTLSNSNSNSTTNTNTLTTTTTTTTTNNNNNKDGNKAVGFTDGGYYNRKCADMTCANAGLYGDSGGKVPFCKAMKTTMNISRFTTVFFVKHVCVCVCVCCSGACFAGRCSYCFLWVDTITITSLLPEPINTQPTESSCMHAIYTRLTI